MPPLHSILVFLAAGLALNLTPGPDMLYVAARGASEGRVAGVASALGIAAGTLVHIALVAGGLAALLTAVPVAYAVVRLAGAAYLVLAFLPQFVDPIRGRPAVQVLVLGLLFNTTGTLVNLAVAFGASRASARLRESTHAALVMERVTGALFVGLGARLAIAGRR